MRSIISYTILVMLAGCFVSHADPSGLATADQGLGDSKNATANAAVAGTAGTAATDDPHMRCELEAKSCYAAGGDTSVCDAMLQKCMPSPVPNPAPGKDAAPCAGPVLDPYVACEMEAKKCYTAGGDTTLCDAMLQKCASIAPPSPAPANDPLACELEAKKCYTAGGDTTICDAMRQKCAPPSVAPAIDPTTCKMEAKKCYDAGGTTTCDAELQKCMTAALPAPTAPQPPTAACDEKLKACLGAGIDPKTCDAQQAQCLAYTAPTLP